MIVDLIKLKSNIDTKIDLDQEISVDNELLKKANIIDLKDAHIKGEIFKGNTSEYIIDALVSGILILPDSVTLDPIEYEFETRVEGNIMDLLEEIGLISKKSEFSIDIFPIIWENILMEVPIRITKNDDIKMEGEGWKLVAEKESITNPAFEKLKDLLK